MEKVENPKLLQWSLYNETRQVRVDELMEPQARALLDGLSKTALKEWWIWNERLDHWVKAEHFLAKPGNESVILLTEAKRQNHKDRRHSRRYAVKFQVYIDYRGFLYHNETINISSGGLRLAKPLPNTVSGMFSVIIVHGSHEINILCRRFHDSSSPSEPRLHIQSCKSADVLLSWMLSKAQAA